MIAARHAWLLRSPSVCFEDVDSPRGSGLYVCKLCSAREHPTKVTRAQQTAHFAAHQREKVAAREKQDDFLELVEA